MARGGLGTRCTGAAGLTFGRSRDSAGIGRGSGEEGLSAVTSGHGPHDRDGGLDRLRRQYPRWRFWRGQATGNYWAMPPRDHPTQRELIAADDLEELSVRIAQAEGYPDR